MDWFESSNLKINHNDGWIVESNLTKDNDIHFNIKGKVSQLML